MALRFDAGLTTSGGLGCPKIGTAPALASIQTAGAVWVWGDVDCSGEVNPVDALKLLRKDAGLNVSQPAGCPEIGSTVLF